KYPKDLPQVYRTILVKRPHLRSESVARAIAQSSLPRENKRKLYLYAAGHKNLEHRWAALRELKDLDPKEFVMGLIRTLESLPKTPAQPYGRCPEGSFAELVTETADPGVWVALAKAAKRADVGLRLELMKPMDSSAGGRFRKERLAFLASFLSDTAVRDAK